MSEPTMDLAPARDLLLTQLARLKPSRPRALDEGDVEHALSLLQRAVSTYHDGETAGWRVVLYGGFLPNSYKWRAETDVLVLYGERGEGDTVRITTADLTRTVACKRSRGKGSLCVVHVLKVGQTTGRVVELD